MTQKCETLGWVPSDLKCLHLQRASSVCGGQIRRSLEAAAGGTCQLLFPLLESNEDFFDTLHGSAVGAIHSLG